jgi:FkbM family methyltransferase
MAIFANDLIGISINQFGFYERDELDVLFEFLLPLAAVFRSGTAFDIGANIGNHSVYFARRFKLVHSFEPNPHAYQLLNLNSQCLTNVIPHNIGLGDVKGTFDLLVNPTNVGGSPITIGHRSTDNLVKVAVDRLDDIDVESSELCFLKVDVEGFEARVLQGASETIRSRQPLIVFEQNEAEFHKGLPEPISLLHAMGYKVCWHQSGTVSKSWVLRRLVNLKEVLFGRVHKVLTATVVPEKTYLMLIAVPPRFGKQLGVE